MPEGLNTRRRPEDAVCQPVRANCGLNPCVFKEPGACDIDEASSRLDPATEQLLETAIDSLLKGRTAIIIAHRLKTLNRTERILILDEGSACEFGERLKLLKDPESRFYSLHQTGLEELLA